MSLLLLEALGAMVLLLLIVWWTMFSGRKNGELSDWEATQVMEEARPTTLADKPKASDELK